MPSKPSGVSTCLPVLVLVLALAAPARAEVPPRDDTASWESRVDSLVTRQLTAYRIPGATVAVVRDGRVVLARGYGDADAEHHTPVEAARTLFRVASIGKLFVWTAVMQLAEQGRLDLDADINTYLGDVRIPATYPQPITLAHLMAHTGGFEAHERLWAEGTPPDSLATYLKQRMPARVRPPGELSAYSDYGTSLAEHIVEQVSGQPFEQYLQANVLEPLGMKRTLFRRTVPPELATDVALGHALEHGSPRAQPLEQVVVASSGSMLTTATDLTRFMLAHLQGGQDEGHRILREDTVRRMHRQHFTHDPRLSGWAHGFMEFQLNGHRLIGHTGDAYLFHSLLVLMPERRMGLFVSYNGPGEKDAAQRARMELLRALPDHDNPDPPANVLTVTKDFAGRAARFEGGYQTTWRAYGTAEASLGWRQEIHVRDGGDGTLHIREPGNAPRRWTEVEPHLFRPAEDVSSPERVAFREDAQGHITHLFFQNRPTEAYERVPWYETSAFTHGLLAVCAALFALAVLGGVLYRSPATGWLAAIGLLHLLFLTGFTLLVRHHSELDYGDTPRLLEASRACALGATVLTPGALVWSARAWWKRSGTRALRLSLTGATLASLAFAAWLHHWHLLGLGS
ncbi:serine hydrolase [Vitiosangium sp. GDMCC 1.1324]|uniref:serine hydrolase domain-containing protein n=1 Tax=Vitiosangium sp. (strain GDMCC 1.1324) TaxID=2138576 RepID=UPI000D39B59D|nr:serine hydrolase domain-containing protein [Vitiosangium sp. GDMCC 1.1324]PTL82085.1 serine hydrolase [Vitiosangium sp. GDMCC 1.1324]